MSCSADHIQQTIPKQQILNFQFSKPIRLDLDCSNWSKIQRSQIRIYKLVVGSGEPDLKSCLGFSMFAYFSEENHTNKTYLGCS